MRKQINIKRYLFILLFSPLLSECAYSGRMDAMDANILIITAASYREFNCNSRPPYYLLMIEDPTEYAVNACVFSLIREPCPFDFYPPICLELYDFDIPGIGPDLSEFPKSDQNLFDKLYSEIF